MDKKTIRDIALRAGADICGIAPASRFSAAPEGFRPEDIWQRCKSVLVFAKRLPPDALSASSCIPYTHVNSVITHLVDDITYEISLALHDEGIANVLIPSDDPYEHWEPENLYGRAILSLRHAAMLAGLGYLGRNTLLINQRYGNLLQLGAVLLGVDIEADPPVTESCPDDCRLCLDACPANALDGITVNQKLCRPLTTYKNEKGYVLKKCYECRRVCPRARGYS